MEEQDSIRLQKKMILMLSVVIFALLLSLMYFKGDYKVAKVATASNDFKLDLITVERKINFDDKNDDMELTEQVAYAASESIEISENIESEPKKEQESINQIKEEAQIKEEIQVEEQVQSQVDNKTNYVSYRSLAENNPPEESEYSSVIEATATAYCLCKKCCGKDASDPWYGYTASGLKIVPGSGVKVIAVDPKVIPLGTNVYVEGLNGAWDYGHALAADTGSAIKNIKIDLYMDSHQETLNWGVRKVNVYILDN